MSITNYFLKCDISGIQSFIFNVPSEGAAKALKSRSIFVKNMADGCLEKLKDFFKDDTVEELYNGGGNFYLEITTDKSAEEIVEKVKGISNTYLESDIFPYIAFIEKNGSIGDLLNEVNHKVQKAKMNRPLSFDLFDAKPIPVPEVDINTIPGINRQVPDGDFEWIAEKSDGDHKLAAVKLDVDNLGSLFKDRTKEDYTTLSKALIDFFDAKLLQLISDLKMRQNIYVVFSGGDDCFLIGTWEKAFKLAIQLRQEFADFQRNLKDKIISLPKDDITFSAGIVVFASHYPMLRLAEEAEDALGASKRAREKNSITVFGKTLTWTEFEQSQKLAATLADLINNKEESKSLLMIFRLIEPKKKGMPNVWRLKYFLRRNVKKENEKVIGQIFDDYSQSLLCKYVGNNSKNPDVWLVASRWAELLMKNSN
jgi:CRISPR-associated protein Csm1